MGLGKDGGAFFPRALTLVATSELRTVKMRILGRISRLFSAIDRARTSGGDS